MATTAVEDADKYDTDYDPIKERKELVVQRTLVLIRNSY